MADDFDRMLMERRRARGASEVEGFDDILKKRRQERPLRAAYEPSLEKQEEKTAPPVARDFGVRMATEPGLELIAEPTMAAAEAMGADDLRNEVTERAAKVAETDPEMAYRMRRRGKMAKADLPGRVLAGVGTAEKAMQIGMAPLAPGFTVGMTLAGATKPGQAILSAPAKAGGAIARAVGAEEGGAGEAAGEFLGGLAPLAASAALARSAGRAGADAKPTMRAVAEAGNQTGEGVLTTAAKIAKGVNSGDVALGNVPEAAGLASGYAGMAAMDSGKHIARMAELDPEGAGYAMLDLAGQVGGMVVQAKAEGGAERAGRLERLNTERPGIQARRALEAPERRAREADMDALARGETPQDTTLLDRMEEVGAVGEGRRPEPDEQDVAEREVYEGKIKESLELGDATKRAAESIGKRKVAPESVEPTDVAGEGAQYRPGDEVTWMDEKNVRRYGTVEGLSPDARVLKVRAVHRRTPYAVDPEIVTKMKRQPRRLPEQPLPDETGPEPVITPRETDLRRREPGRAPNPQVQHDPGIAPEPVDMGGIPAGVKRHPGSPPPQAQEAPQAPPAAPEAPQDPNLHPANVEGREMLRKAIEEVGAKRSAAAAEEYQRRVAHADAGDQWDGLTAADRRALIEKIPPGILDPRTARRRWGSIPVEAQEHLAEVMRDPEAFREALPEPEAPAAASAPPAAPSAKAPEAPAAENVGTPAEVPTSGAAPKPQERTFQSFVESRGVKWPLKTSDPQYKVLFDEFRKGGSNAEPPAPAGRGGGTVPGTTTGAPPTSPAAAAPPAPAPVAKGLADLVPSSEIDFGSDARWAEYQKAMNAPPDPKFPELTPRKMTHEEWLAQEMDPTIQALESQPTGSMVELTQDQGDALMNEVNKNRGNLGPLEGEESPAKTIPGEGHLTWAFKTHSGGFAKLPEGEPTVGRASSVDDIVKAWEKIRDGAELGSMDVSDVIVHKDGKPVARISYNGRVWDPTKEYPASRELTKEDIAGIDSAPAETPPAAPPPENLPGTGGEEQANLFGAPKPEGPEKPAIPPRERIPDDRVGRGDTTKVRVGIPSEHIPKGQVDARWTVKHLDDVLPSHTYTGDQFVPNEEYPQDFQPSRYENLPDALASTERMTKDPESMFQEMTSNAPASFAGMPTTDPTGRVFAGTNRTAWLKWLKENKPKVFAKYRALALKTAESLGIEVPEAVKDAPFLNRELLTTAEENPDLVREFASSSNIADIKSGSASGEAAKLANLIDDDVILRIGSTEEGGLSEAINAAKSKNLRRQLLNEIPPQSRATYYNHETDRFNESGQALLRQLVLRKVGFSEDFLNGVEGRLKQGLEAAAPELIRIRKKHPEYDITKQIEEAATFYQHFEPPEGQDRATYIEDILGQPTFASVTKDMPEQAKAGGGPRMLLDFVLKNATSPAKFKNGIRDLRLAMEQKKGLFKPSPDEFAAMVGQALGVKVRKGAGFGPSQGGGIFLGSLLGGAQGMGPGKWARATGAVLGAAGGMAYASGTDQKDVSEMALYGLLGAMAGYGIGAGKKGYQRDWRMLTQAARETPGASFVLDKAEKAFRWAPARVSPVLAEIVRGAMRERLLGEFRAMEKAKAVPDLEPAHKATTYSYLMGEKGSDAAFEDVVKDLGPEKGEQLRRASDNIKRTVQKMADEAVDLKRLSPESRDEYRNGWLQRLFLNDFSRDAKTFRKFQSSKPSVIENKIRRDGYGLVLHLDAETVNSIAEHTGLEPSIILQKGGNNGTTLIKWEDSAAGSAARDQFLDGLRDFSIASAMMKAKVSKGQVMLRPGEGSRGGISHLVKMKFDPLSMEMREALGETFDPKASTEITLARMAWQNANARETMRIDQGGDAKGRFTAEPPKGSSSGDTFEANGVEYTVAPDSYSWHALKGKGVRSDVWEVLNETRDTHKGFEAFLDRFIGKWKGAKILTPLGTARNFWTDFFYYGPAMGADPLHPGNLKYYLQAAKMINPIKTNVKGVARVLRDIGADPHIGDRPDVIEGSEAIFQKIKRGQGTEDGWAQFGDFMGDLLTGGGTARGGRQAVLAALRATAGAATGAALADEDEGLKGAAYGAAAGLAMAPALRFGRAVYASIDPLFKTAAYLKMRDKGMSKAEAREEVRKFSQVFAESAPFTEWAQGKRGGTLGRLLGNPFVSFQVENARIMANLAKEKPVLFGQLMLRKEMMTLMGLGVMAAAGVTLPGSTKEEARASRHAFPSMTTGPVPIMSDDGNLRMFDTAQFFPGTESAQNLQAVMSNPDKGKAITEELRDYILSGPLVGTGYRAMAMWADPAGAKDPRTGLPIRRRGESPSQAFGKRTAEEFIHPWMPGGTGFKKMTDAGLVPGYDRKKYEDNLYARPRSGRAWTLMEQLAGVRTDSLDFPKVESGISSEVSHNINERKQRLQADLMAPNLTDAQVNRLYADFDKDIDEYLQREEDRRKRELPRPREMVTR